MAVEVAAAVIERADGAFLLARRPAGKPYAGYWEFPGGKIETGERADAALARELHEELGIRPRIAFPWITREFTYPHAAVRLRFFRVTSWEGEPHPREGQAIAWQRLDEPMAAPMLPANAPVLAALALPLEYAITDAEARGRQAMLDRIRVRLADGVRLVQVRDKDLADRDSYAQEVLNLARAHGARVLINGGPFRDAGVHFTTAQLLALRERPRGVLAAASCHDAAQLQRAMALELDFAVLGPVKATRSHPGARLLGWDGFARLARGASIPVFAIGGLRREDLEDARRSGAHGLAMIRGAWD